MRVPRAESGILDAVERGRILASSFAMRWIAIGIVAWAGACHREARSDVHIVDSSAPAVVVTRTVAAETMSGPEKGGCEGYGLTASSSSGCSLSDVSVRGGASPFDAIAIVTVEQHVTFPLGFRTVAMRIGASWYLAKTWELDDGYVSDEPRTLFELHHVRLVDAYVGGASPIVQLDFEIHWSTMRPEPGDSSIPPVSKFTGDHVTIASLLCGRGPSGPSAIGVLWGEGKAARSIAPSAKGGVALLASDGAFLRAHDQALLSKPPNDALVGGIAWTWP